MAQKIRLIGDESHLLFEFQPFNHTADKQPDGLWTGLRLSVNGEEVWGGEDGSPLQWSWVDLLEWLAEVWPWLVLEENLPLPLEKHILYPDQLLDHVEKWWEDSPDKLIEKQELQVMEFLQRHDLAHALKGLYCPSLYILRQGSQYLISNTSFDIALCHPQEEIVRTLEEVGNFLAETGSKSADPRTANAVAQWRLRSSKLARHKLELESGCPENVQQQLEIFAESADELKAAARMSYGIVPVAEQKRLLEKLRLTKKQNTPDLDNLTQEVLKSFQEIGRPYEQGYWLAEFLRSKLGLPADARVEIEEILRKWGVSIEEIALSSSTKIDALSAWGAAHGPVVLVNVSDRPPAHHFGKRSTLAHEACHLLIDRKRALPVGEVFGGRVPKLIESRANAFAAELLLPREIASKVYRNSNSLQRAEPKLQQRYEVGQKLIYHQIRNSGVLLSPEDEVTIDSILNS